jgi:hypothetical protein
MYSVTLNGDYSLNGQPYSSGSVLTLGISGTSITLNGSVQAEINLIPSNAGSYTVEAYVKDSISTKAYDFKEAQNFNVYAPVAITTLNKDVGNVFNGDTVNFSTAIGGGSNKETTYKFQVMKDGEEVFARDYDINSSLQYVPTISGNYEVNVFAKDALSLANYDDVRNLSFTVYSPELSTTTASGSFFEGKPITLNSSSVGGSVLGFSYKYEVYRNAKRSC